jgi:hypothetical protein
MYFGQFKEANTYVTQNMSSECMKHKYLYYWFRVGEDTFWLHHLISDFIPARPAILPLSHRQVISR